MSSVITGRDRDCPSCRAFSGAGLLGIGGYLAHATSKNPSLLGKTVIMGFASCFSILGMCRICDWPPFRKTPIKTVSE